MPPSMSSGRGGSQAEIRTALLTTAVEAIATELRLVDVADYIAFIRAEQFANIRDIVNSSVELVFRPGALSYGFAAAFELDWDRPPTIILDMEFRRGRVLIFFKLVLSANQSSVSIQSFSAGDPASDPEADTQRMIEALAAARLPSSPA